MSSPAPSNSPPASKRPAETSDISELVHKAKASRYAAPKPPDDDEDLEDLLEKQLTCSICTDLYLNPVLVLPCMHSFCGLPPTDADCSSEPAQACTDMFDQVPVRLAGCAPTPPARPAGAWWSTRSRMRERPIWLNSSWRSSRTRSGPTMSSRSSTLSTLLGKRSEPPAIAQRVCLLTQQITIFNEEEDYGSEEEDDDGEPDRSGGRRAPLGPCECCDPNNPHGFVCPTPVPADAAEGGTNNRPPSTGHALCTYCGASVPTLWRPFQCDVCAEVCCGNMFRCPGNGDHEGYIASVQGWVSPVSPGGRVLMFV